jgi:hypothetical protein
MYAKTVWLRYGLTSGRVLPNWLADKLGTCIRVPSVGLGVSPAPIRFRLGVIIRSHIVILGVDPTVKLYSISTVT